MDTSIERQLEAASIPLNSPDLLVHANLGESYRIRFERFGRIKDIDSSIEQLVKEAASVPLDSVRYPGIMTRLGN